jgi:hypothetical protein
MQEQVCCVFGIHPRNFCIRIFSRIMAKLSVACRNQDIARHTRRKEFLQLQVDIVCVVKKEKPVSLALACKPTQTRICRSLSISWSDGLKIRLKSLLICRVNVEDVGEAKNEKLQIVTSRDSIDSRAIPGGFLHEFESKLALSGTTKAV